MIDWTMLTKQQLENDAEDRAGDSSAMDHILTGLALYARIAELEAEVAMWQRMARDGAEHEVAGLERIAELEAGLTALCYERDQDDERYRRMQAKLTNAESMMSLQLRLIQQAEAELAERDRMLHLAARERPLFELNGRMQTADDWLAELHRRAEEGEVTKTR